MSIGAFAAACGLSVPMLRRYDEAGVLVPAQVDARTGYRWYAAGQIPTAVLIGTLRQLDVPLPEVTAILAEPDPPAQLARLETHWASVESTLQRGRAMRDHLARLLGGWQDLIDEHAVRQRPVRDRPVLLRRRRVDLRHYQQTVRAMAADLRVRAQHDDLPVTGVPVSVYPVLRDEVLDDRHRTVEVCLPVDGTGDAVLPGGQLLYLEASGPDADYPEVLSAYGAVAQWAYRCDLALTGPPLMVHVGDGDVLAGWCIPQARPSGDD